MAVFQAGTDESHPAVRLVLLLILLLSWPALSQIRQRVEVRYGNIEEVKALLTTLVEGVEVEQEDERFLIISGSPQAVDQFLELLEQIDREPERVTVECRVVLETPEIDEQFGPLWVGRRQDWPPVVLHWDSPEPPDWTSSAAVGYLDDLNFVRNLPGVLSFHKIQAWSGLELDFGTPPDLVWHLTPKVKQDGYVVFKFLPETMLRKFTTDCRIKFGDTFVLGGFASAEELGLPGQGPVLLMITATPGW